MSLRERQLALSNGSVVLRMGLHEVVVLLGEDQVGQVRFRALGSANSEEPPVYRLQDMQLNDALMNHSANIGQEAISLFAAYTGARVITPKR